MRAPANPPAKPLGRLALTFVALLLATVSMTTPAKADEPSGAADGESAVVADVAGESADSASDAGHPEPSGAPTLAGYLASGMLRVSADVALVDGGVKSYMIDDRQLTRFDLPALQKQIEEAEAKVDELENLLNGQRPRRAVGVLPRDW